jgi:methionyl aminopeptidase
VSVKTPEELAGLRAAGVVVHKMLRAMKAAVRPGITTAELDEVGATVMRQHGGRSAPALVYQFPCISCISINDEAVHGIPGSRRLKQGDLVKLDVTVEKDGFMADAAITVPVGAVSEISQGLVGCADASFAKAIQVARAGVRISEIGRAVEREVGRWGFSVIRALGGHGIGRTIHEQPSIPNYFDPQTREVLTDGLVITNEPIIAAGSGMAFLAEDGWTVKTADHTNAAHFEHTLMITKDMPVLLTA